MLVDMTEVPRDVSGVLVEGKGVTVLWVVADVDVSVDIVAECVTSLVGVPVL